jgi:hypothetical protein
MGFILDYIQAVAKIDPFAARELVNLNHSVVAKEMGIKINPVNDIKTRPQRTKDIPPEK